MSAREESLLQPRKATEINPDEWAEFKIKKVTVNSKKTGAIVSLLSAHQNSPVRVCGKLEAVDDDLRHLGRRPKSQNSSSFLIADSSTRQEVPRESH